MTLDETKTYQNSFNMWGLYSPKVATPLEAAVHSGVDQHRGTIVILLPAHSLQPSLAKPEGMVAMA